MLEWLSGLIATAAEAKRSPCNSQPSACTIAAEYFDSNPISMVFPGFSAATPASTAVTPTAAPAVMLEGKALLDKARSLSNRPEDQIARACGYVGPSGRLLKKSFYRALILAKGYKLPEGASGTGVRGGVSSGGRSAGAGAGHGKGRQAEFRTRVHGNGNLLIGQTYTRLMGLEPGQEFRIELEQETGSILLLPLPEASEFNLNDPSADGEADEQGLDGFDALD
jgi:hypothetical protein